MGMWQGILQGMNMIQEEREAEKDRALQREMFERKIFEDRRNAMLPELRALREARQERLSRINTGVAIGLEPPVANALERSGQLGLFISSYDSNDGMDPQYVSSLNRYITERLSDADDETVAEVALNGINTERDVSDPDEALLAISEAFFSASDSGDLDEIADMLSSASSTGGRIRPFSVSFGGASGLTQAETKAIRRELAETLNTYFEDAFEIQDGDVIITSQASDEIQDLFNEAERAARGLASGPQRQFVATDAANFISTRIQEAVRGMDQVDAGVLYEGFNVLVASPEDFLQTYVGGGPTELSFGDTSRLQDSATQRPIVSDAPTMPQVAAQNIADTSTRGGSAVRRTTPARNQEEEPVNNSFSIDVGRAMGSQ